MKNILTTFSLAMLPTEEIDWQEVYDQSLPRIFHYFCYKVGDSTLAEELTAITFEKAWKSRRNYKKGLGALYSWLMGIARNVVNDQFRKTEREVPLETLSEAQMCVSFDEDLQRKLDFQAIIALLSQYPARERDLIAMKYGAEMSNREIARLTGLSESNVGTILYRVVCKLKLEWEKDHE